MGVSIETEMRYITKFQLKLKYILIVTFVVCKILIPGTCLKLKGKLRKETSLFFVTQVHG